MTNDKIHWGLLGAGNIVRHFANGLSACEDAVFHGAAGRTKSKVEAFVKEVSPKYEKQEEPIQIYDTMEDLLADPAIDVVYIGLSNQAHYTYAKKCIEAGKAVLCEKPFMLNAKQAKEIVELAREHGVFCMEAMWTKFLPGMASILKETGEGPIGPVHYIHAAFGGGTNPVDPTHRYFDPALGGGSLLDVGIYSVTFALEVMGRMPDEVRCFAAVGETGVDEVNDIEFLYKETTEDGRLEQRMCHLSSSVRFEVGEDAIVCGEKGRLFVPHFYAPSDYQRKIDGVVYNVEAPVEENGYEYEAREVMQCLREGKTESEKHPLSRTLEVITLFDRMRQLWGVTYPED